MNFLLPLLMFFVTFGVLLLGFPVAFSLAGTALWFSVIGVGFGHFDLNFLGALPERVYGIMINETLIAVPLFVFMGLMLERAKIAEELLETMAEVFGKVRGGLALSVCLVGGLLAASTGIVGATVVTMGLISLPTMLKRKYSNEVAAGIVCASGTLGQIIPPSIVLIILGDVIGSAHQQAQLAAGNFSPSTVSVGDLFAGALLPGIVLMALYMVYILGLGLVKSQQIPESVLVERGRETLCLRVLKVLIPPLMLIVLVLGSILFGVATPSEAASVGSVGAIVLSSLKGKLSKQAINEVSLKTTKITAMVFTILIGASFFSLVFRGFEGDEIVRNLLLSLGGGVGFSFFVVMVVIFLLGFFLDFFEITFVVVPIVGPILLGLGLDPIWLGVMIALNLQTSFLTPPFGFSLFYIRGVAPASITTSQIYRGAVPFIVIQIVVLTLLWFFPQMATWLPSIG